MATELLGKAYQDGETILEQGAPGGLMFVVQEGLVEVVKETSGRETRLAVRGPGEFVGEMEIFDQGPCAATVRALGPARVLTIDKRTFLRQISEDPTLAFHLMQQMAARIRAVDAEVIRLSGAAESAPGRSQAEGLDRRGSPKPRQAAQRAWCPPIGRWWPIPGAGAWAAQAAWRAR